MINFNSSKCWGNCIHQMRHQEHPFSLVHLGSMSYRQSVSILWSVSCTVPAGSEVKTQEGKQSLGVVLQLWSESLNGRPMLQKRLDVLILSLSLTLHGLCPSCNITCMAKVVNRRAEVWEVCNWRIGSADMNTTCPVGPGFHPQLLCFALHLRV